MQLHFAAPDQGENHRRSLTAVVEADKVPSLPAKTVQPEGPFCGANRETDAAVVEEAGDAVPTLQHVILRLGHDGVTRVPGGSVRMQSSRP